MRRHQPQRCCKISWSKSITEATLADSTGAGPLGGAGQIGAFR
jgi:hypothetical protein